jgi:hypothetical protein
MKLTGIACLTLVIATSLSAAPAVPAKPRLVGTEEFFVTHASLAKGDPNDPVDEWTGLPQKWSHLYFAGDWHGLQNSVMAELAQLKQLHFDFDKNIYSVVIRTTERDAKGELIRFLVGKQVTEPWSSNLRGAATFHELFVTADVGSGMQSFLSNTPLPDPREAQVEGFLKALPLGSIVNVLAELRRNAPLTAEIRSIGPQPPPQPQPPPSGVRHGAALYEADLLPAISSIAIQTFVASPEDKPEDLIKPIDDMHSDLVTRDARASANCLALLNDKLKEAATAAIQQTEADRDAAAKKLDDAGRAIAAKNLREAPLTAAERKATAEAVHAAYTAFATSAANCTADDTARMLHIEDLYAKLVTTKSSEITTASFTQDNVPLRRWNVSTTAGAIVHAFDDQRATVADGKLVRKELRGEKFASLNVVFNPVAYDPTNSRLTPAERWRVFAGVVATPEIGIAAGVDYSIYKAFGISVGYALMRVEESTGAVAFGATVPDTVTNPTRKSSAGGIFVGFSFQF